MMQLINMRQRKDTEDMRNTLERKFNIGLGDGLDVIDNNLKMHALDPDGNGF